MTIPEDIVKVTFGFDLGTPPYEIAQFGFHLRYQSDSAFPAEPWDGMTDHVAGQMADSFNSFWDDVRGHFCTTISPSYVKCTHLDTTGHALDVATAPLTADNGSSAGDSMPYECSMAVTLYGYDPGHFVPNSRRRRGRFYLPPLRSSDCDDQGLFKATAMDELGNAVDAFLEDVQGTRSASGEPSSGYFRLVTVSAVGAGRWDQVFAHAIGNVPDAQRRRRNGRAETYRTMALSSA